MPNDTQVAAQAPTKIAETVADTATKVANETANVAKRERATTKRRAERANAPAAAAAKPTRKYTRRAKTTRTATRTTRTSARTAAAAAQKGINTVTNTSKTFFAGFDSIPTIAPFQSLFANAGERGQDAVRRSQASAEQLNDFARANVEAIVEAGRVAVEGARSIGQDAVARGRNGVEQAADAVRSLAEAKSPTEYLQIQGELARSSFDRMVAESSRLTESLVKLAGEAFQPLSNRATANVERMNDLVA